VIGTILLISALCLFILAFLLSLMSLTVKRLRNFFTSFLYAPIVFTLLCYGYFVSIFLTHQFQYDVVYRNTNLLMSKSSILAATWAGQAGSLLLWSLFGCIVLILANRDKKWKEYVLPILLVQQIVLMFLIWNAKPFARVLIEFKDGLGLNPVLSHIYMVIHPPFAFLGYAFLSLVFAYCIASLMTNNFSEWVVIIRKYVLIALFGLTTAIVLGSLWAYQTSGWGGYWAFDPIESGSLITCLLLFAILHLINLYKSNLIGLKLLYFAVILCFSSQIHLVFLIRSGLLKNITQHSYTSPGLFVGLLMADLLYFGIPLILLICKLNKFSTSMDPGKIKSRSGRLRLVAWLFVLMAIVLFVDIHVPIVFSYFEISLFSLNRQSQLLNLVSLNLKRIFGGFVFLSFIAMTVQSSIFSKNRTIRTHSLNKNLLELLLAMLLTILLFLIMNMGFSSKSYILGLLLLFPSFGIAKIFLGIRKIPIWKWGKELGHLGVFLLFISILLSSVNNTVESICLEKNVPYDTPNYSLTLQGNVKKIQKYSGYQEVYTILINRNPFQVYATPAQWVYDRDKGQIEMRIPSIQILPDTDIEITLKQKGLKTLVLGKETKLNDITLTLKELYITVDRYGNKTEHAVINLQKVIQIPDQEDQLIQEEHELTKIVTQSGSSLEKVKVKSSLYSEEIEWVKSGENSIYCQSPRISESIEFEIRTKPFMLGLRFSYFLLIASLIWMIISLVFETKLKKWGKKKKPSSFTFRTHHTQKHHHH